MAKQLSFGVVAAAFSADARVAASMARQMGFAGVQFDAVNSNLDLTSLSDTGRREFRHLFAQENLILSSLRATAGSRGFLPGSDVDQTLWRLEQAIKTAADLAAPMVCLDVGPLPAPSDEKFSDQIGAALAELGRRADRYGVVIALYSELAGMAAIRRAVEIAACPWFGVNFDPVAVLQDGTEMRKAVADFSRIIRTVRGRDAIGGADRRTRPAPVGQGAINWEQLLKLLDDSHYSGWITLDTIELPDRANSARAGLKHLNAIVTNS